MLTAMLKLQSPADVYACKHTEAGGLQLDVTQRKSTALKRLLACMPIHPSAMDARADLQALDRQRKLLAASGKLLIA